MSFLSQIKNAIEDISSLQIATLYGSAMSLDSGIDQALKAELEQKIADQVTAVNLARSQWLAATELPERWNLHREYRAAKSRLSELREEYNGVSPTDIFERAQLAMGHAKTAGYTRLQLAGDSTNYYDAELTADQTFLIDAHKANVEAAIAARQKLVDTASSLLKIGHPPPNTHLARLPPNHRLAIRQSPAAHVAAPPRRRHPVPRGSRLSQ